MRAHLEAPHMSIFRCYFLDIGGHLSSPPEIIDANNGTEALEKVFNILKAHRLWYSIEIWHEGRHLYSASSEIKCLGVCRTGVR